MVVKACVDGSGVVEVRIGVVGSGLVERAAFGPGVELGAAVVRAGVVGSGVGGETGDSMEIMALETKAVGVVVKPVANVDMVTREDWVEVAPTAEEV